MEGRVGEGVAVGGSVNAALGVSVRATTVAEGEPVDPSEGLALGEGSGVRVPAGGLALGVPEAQAVTVAAAAVAVLKPPPPPLVLVASSGEAVTLGVAPVIACTVRLGRGLGVD